MAATPTAHRDMLGRARRGQRLKMRDPFGHWGTQTFIAALRHDGLTAPWVIDCPMNRRIFETYVETQLAPSRLCGKPSDQSAISARQMSAGTTSEKPGMLQINCTMLSSARLALASADGRTRPQP